jgi:4-hydroxybenzoate polyprenyltransferase
MLLRLPHLGESRNNDTCVNIPVEAERGSAGVLHEAAPTPTSVKRNVADFLIHNRVHLLPTAVLIMWAMPPWYGSAPAWAAAPAVLLAGAGIYHLNRVFDLVEDEINDPGAHAQTVAAKSIVLAAAIGAIVTSVVLAVALMRPLAVITLSLATALGVLYSVPFFRGNQQKLRRLKQVPIVKNVIPSVVWPFATILCQVLSGSGTHFLLPLGLALAWLSCGVFTIEVAWDIRDSRGDRIAGIETLATAFGVRRAILVPLVASSALALSIVLLVWRGDLDMAWLLPALLVVLLAVLTYLLKYALAFNRYVSHFLILVTIFSLVSMGLVGRWVA